MYNVSLTIIQNQIIIYEATKDYQAGNEPGIKITR